MGPALAAGRRVVVVAAHPDDETIGASAILGAAREAVVLHLTDGAPRDLRFRPTGRDGRDAYARRRRDEAIAALALVGIEPPRIERLGGVDQGLADDLVGLARRLARRLDELAPELVVTHAYEGGHPDHDAAAFAVAAARALAARPPPRCLEMALYHGAGPGFRAGELLASTSPVVAHVLDGDERARRVAMIRCFRSQAEVLAPFLGVAVERYRDAPGYDFAAPPHPGALMYEQWGFPITGARWRELAAAARRLLRSESTAKGATPWDESARRTGCRSSTC